MTANSVAPAFTGQFRELPEAECLELLKTKQLGRVAYHDDGPVVLPIPVKYVIDEGTVLFRTSPHSSLAQHMRATHAVFQVDEIDDETDAGWSVLIRGTTTYVDCRDLSEVAGRLPPWHEGLQSLHVRITPRVIRGRRSGVIGAPHPTRTNGPALMCLWHETSDPIAVTHHAATLTEALNGATDKLEARLTSKFERDEGNESRESIRGR